mmetsp:Transcript_32343/g.82416  ORF Transcript_32343/g.82416 Transcript_32343/m.82416 type:complete len:203 (+) Transcript_32343:2981-3589(+)
MTCWCCARAPYFTCLIPSQIDCCASLTGSLLKETRVAIISQNLTERICLGLLKRVPMLGASSKSTSKNISPNSLPGQLSMAMSQDWERMVASLLASSSDMMNDWLIHVQSHSHAARISVVNCPFIVSSRVSTKARPKPGRNSAFTPFLMCIGARALSCSCIDAGLSVEATIESRISPNLGPRTSVPDENMWARSWERLRNVV